MKGKVLSNLTYMNTFLTVKPDVILYCKLKALNSLLNMMNRKKIRTTIFHFFTVSSTGYLPEMAPLHSLSERPHTNI